MSGIEYAHDLSRRRTHPEQESGPDDDKLDDLASPTTEKLAQVEEAKAVVTKVVQRSVLDPNFDHNLREEAAAALEQGDAGQAVAIDHLIEDDSPYPEVRAAVSNTDDPSMPTNTFRMWFLAMIFTIIISALNQFFAMRYPTVQITPLVAQLLAFPAGRFMHWALPSRGAIGRFLNPGPFNIKEHTIIVVCANAVYGGAYATDIIAAQRVFYKQNWGAGYQILLVLTTQVIGFSLAGFSRRYLVWPAAMIWPANLVYTALLNTLHNTRGNEDGGITRERFFLFAFLGAFFWYWLPGYLFTALSTFSWVCWIRPNSIRVNQLFGVSSGLGMGIFTFDWNQIAYIGSPLVTPWWAEVNVLAGFMFMFWFVCPILYYTNVWNAQYLPMSDNQGYDRFGQTYNVSMVTTPQGTIDEAAYHAYSPLYLPMTFALAYGLSFASITSTLVHTYLFYRHDIVRQFKSSLSDEPDVHAKLMSVYKEAPDWWFGIIFLISFALSIVTIEVWPTEFPVWAFILALIISIIYVVPIGLIQAITNQQVGLNVITEFIIGFALPGRPVAMMIFKTFGYITMAQALSFISDLKLGHYMKVPPRDLFWAQTTATVLGAIVVVGVQDWMFGNVEGICTKSQSDDFTCPHTHVFGTASVVWGLIGPARMYSPGKIYNALLWWFLIGATLPVPFYFLAKRYPTRWFKYVNIPLIMTGTGLLPPATGINFSSWGIVGFIFQYWLRRYRFKWWSKYNYLTSAGMDAGTAVSSIIIFFCLFYPKAGKIGQNTISAWWGNTVYQNTADAQYLPLKTAPASGFGPDTWA